MAESTLNLLVKQVANQLASDLGVVVVDEKQFNKEVERALLSSVINNLQSGRLIIQGVLAKDDGK